jgi:hypothetical protein
MAELGPVESDDNGGFEKVSHTDEELINSRGLEELQPEPAEKPQLVEPEVVPAKELSPAGEPPVAVKCALFGPATPTTEISTTCGGCCIMKNLDPRVYDLLLWRDVRKTGVVFASLVILLSLFAAFSALSVVSYFSLAILTVTFSFRAYWHAVQTVKKTTDENPLKKYLDVPLTVSDESVHRHADIIAKHVVQLANDLRKIFFVENILDSLKCALVLWVLTYVGACFNGLTLFTIAVVGLFTLPKVYNLYKAPINNVLGLACNKMRDVCKMVQDRVPMLSKKKQA